MNDARSQQDAADYEALRSQAVLAGIGQGLTLLPCGLAGWLSAKSPAAELQTLPTTPPPTEVFSCGPLPAAIASIVQRLVREAADA